MTEVIVHVQVERPSRWHKINHVVHVSPAPCTHEVRVVAGERVLWVACGRRLPAHRQCAGCRIRLIIESDQSVLPFDLPLDLNGVS